MQKEWEQRTSPEAPSDGRTVTVLLILSISAAAAAPLPREFAGRVADSASVMPAHSCSRYRPVRSCSEKPLTRN